MYMPVVDKLIGRLEDVLAKEAELIWRVPGEVKDFKTELENMQAFLIDVDQGEMHEQFIEEVEKKWVADIRDKAHEAEDIIDEFTYHMNKLHHDDAISCLSWFLQLVIDAPTTLWVMHQTAHKLQKVKKSITDITERHTRYRSGGSAHNAAGRMRTRYLEQQRTIRILRDQSYFTEEKSIIGFSRETELLKQLMLPTSGRLRTIISVIGMGGSGKTTLVSKIYKNQGGLGGFVLSAWITVSQIYTVIELLKHLIRKLCNVENKKVPEELDNMEYINLVELVKGYLKGKRYLLVLDDVWDTDVWKQIKVAFPEDEVGSRILITTRDERNAPSLYKVHVGQLQGSESWDLFSMKAFADCPNKTCPEELNLLAQVFVNDCNGLPLALVTLGRHMSSKRQEKEWIEAYKSLYKTLDMNYVKNILMLSFSDLPYSLKHCFLDCCTFPEDYPIVRTRLIRRWIAEGFVESSQKSTPEEVAESYISELIFRSMLLVETRNVSGRPKVVKMHDVMRDFALEIAKKEKFCGVGDGREAMTEFEGYRLSIHCSSYMPELKLPSSDMTRIRSLSVIGKPQPPFPKEHLLKFKMLRLLDLESSHNEAGDEVGHFFNLRYLKLRGQSIRNLPSSIERLLNLQTLDVSETYISELPEGVSKLRKLRHLILQRRQYSKTRITFDITKLNQLQVLTDVYVSNSNILRQLGTLTQLTRLDIVYIHDAGEVLEERRKNWEALSQLELLQRFYVRSKGPKNWGNQNLMTLPVNLKKIHLNVNIRFESHWTRSLQNVEHMTLIDCYIDGDQLHQIAALRELVSLKLTISFFGDEVLLFGGGFVKLKHLTLFELFESKKVIFEQGTMPNVESLSIRYCEGLPEGIEHLTSLQKLEFQVPKVMEKSYERDIKNWESKLQHIPTIDIKMIY